MEAVSWDVLWSKREGRGDTGKLVREVRKCRGSMADLQQRATQRWLAAESNTTAGLQPLQVQRGGRIEHGGGERGRSARAAERQREN